MSQCRSIRKKLSAYQDGEVGAAQKTAIETHIHGCKACRSHYEGIEQTYRQLKRCPDIQADAGLSRRIVNRGLESQAPPRHRIKGHIDRLLPRPALVTALAVAGVLMGTLTGLFWKSQHAHPGRTSAAFQSDPALTLVSVRAFDAAPPGSFARVYLQLADFSPETRHEK